MKTFSRIAGLALLSLAAITTAYAEDAALSGDWTKKSYSIRGNWSIVTTDEGRFLELDDAFKTRNAPDLKLFLSTLPADSVTSRNAVSHGTLIAPLKSNKGTQRYKLPDGVDLADYESLVLHCERFSKLWGVSAL